MRGPPGLPRDMPGGPLAVPERWQDVLWGRCGALCPVAAGRVLVGLLGSFRIGSQVIWWIPSCPECSKQLKNQRHFDCRVPLLELSGAREVPEEGSQASAGGPRGEVQSYR